MILNAVPTAAHCAGLDVNDELPDFIRMLENNRLHRYVLAKSRESADLALIFFGKRREDGKKFKNLRYPPACPRMSDVL